MYLSRITVDNFRNFRCLDVSLAGNVVIVGENWVGKSNLLWRLRLIFDSVVARQRSRAVSATSGTGLKNLDEESRIPVSVEIRESDDDPDVSLC